MSCWPGPCHWQEQLPNSSGALGQHARHVTALSAVTACTKALFQLSPAGVAHIRLCCFVSVCLTDNLQNLLNGNVTKLSALRYGDAKTLPATDVHLKPGFDAIPKGLLPGLNVTYNASESRTEIQM